MPSSTRGREQLQAAGFSARSGWLTSSTFGGISWLAHSTLQSGVWVDSQGRYDQLVASDRFTLSQAFKRGGLADRRRRAVERPRLAGGGGVLPLRPGLRPAATSATAARSTRTPPCPTSTSSRALQRLELAQARPAAHLRGGRPGLQPHAVDADPAADRLERRRRRLDLQPAAGRRERGWSDDTQGGVRPVDRVHDERPGLLRAALRRPTNLVLVVLGDHQPSTIVTGHDAEPRRADLDHRPRPGGAGPDRRLGLGRTACARARRRRSGR